MKKQTTLTRASSLLVAASLLVPLAAGCGSPAPPVAPMQSAPVANTNTGLSTKQKVVLLAGAAALYYYYNRSKKANAAKFQGQNIQYYLSKSTGRVYYRDPQNPKKVYWVTPPPQQAQNYQVPAGEATEYQAFQGYNGATSGRELSDVFPVR